MSNDSIHKRLNNHQYLLVLFVKNFDVAVFLVEFDFIWNFTYSIAFSYLFDSYYFLFLCWHETPISKHKWYKELNISSNWQVSIISFLGVDQFQSYICDRIFWCIFDSFNARIHVLQTLNSGLTRLIASLDNSIPSNSHDDYLNWNNHEYLDEYHP